MNIDIQARGFTLTEALKDYIERRINFTLSSRFNQVNRISVRLLDINGPRGGVDMCCRIHINLPRLKDIVIEDIEHDLYVAIDRATDRASRTTHRRLARQFYKNRKIFVPHKNALSPKLATGLNLE